jgi:hypothetical protein
MRSERARPRAQQAINHKRQAPKLHLTVSHPAITIFSVNRKLNLLLSKALLLSGAAVGF